MAIEPSVRYTAPALTLPQEEMLEGWLRDLGPTSVRLWKHHLAFAGHVEVKGWDLLQAGPWLACLPETAHVHRVRPGGGRGPILLVLPRPLVLALVNGLLGDPLEEVPEDRDLTPVETSLCRYTLQTLLLDALPHVGPGGERLSFSIQERVTEFSAAPAFDPSDPSLLCSLLVSGPFGELDGFLLLPVRDWLPTGSSVRPPASAAARPTEHEKHPVRPRLSKTT